MSPNQIYELLKIYNSPTESTIDLFKLRAILYQTSLHLARFDEHVLNQSIILQEYEAQKNLVFNEIGNLKFPKTNKELSNLKFKEVKTEIAKIILEKLHYLKSFREDSLHFGLFDDNYELPVALNSYSANDIPKLKSYAGNSLILSRVFSFQSAPRNSLSFLFSKSRAAIKKNVNNTMLFTYINPNLGFKGSSYLADNWVFYDTENTIYTYENNIYKTERYILQKYGKSTAQLLESNTEGISISKAHQLPLQIFKRNF